MAALSLTPLSFGSYLRQIREQLGHKSMKAFYEFLRKNSQELLFNYPYYTLIESDSQFPSAKVVEQIAKIVGRQYGPAIVQIYCSILFKEIPDAFNLEKIPQSLKPGKKQPLKIKDEKKISLPMSAVQTLSQAKEYYFVFLLVVLFGKQLSEDDLAKKLNLSLEHLQPILEHLIERKLIQLNGRYVERVAHYFHFPKKHTDTRLPDIYKKFELWEREFVLLCGLGTHVEKAVIRRTPKKLIPLLVAQCENLVRYIEATENLNIEENDGTFAFEIHLSTDWEKG